MINTVVKLIFLFLVFQLTGCEQNQTKTMEEDLRPNIEKIEAVMKNYVSYWNDNDMDSWGTLFTDDVDYINRRGGWWKNNKDNIEGHRHIHKMMVETGQPKTFRLEIGQIEFIKPDVAIVHALSEWPGFKSYGKEGNTETLRGVLTCVFVKVEGEWLIRILHNTLREEDGKQ